MICISSEAAGTARTRKTGSRPKCCSARDGINPVILKSYPGAVQNPARLSQALLAWYRKKSRKGLPWRETRDPYRVWISEAMLQQTQVATVIPYYRRFLSRFPTVQTLSRAAVTDVLESWSGLGYYSRAKNLHACAQTIVREHAGRLPDEVDSLMKLPGIGRTTAGAIASIAYDRPAPVLDGNVQRVFSRYFGIQEDPRQPAVQRRLWELAERLVPGKSPGDFNQALMDLGATVCTPRQPRCALCPLSRGCRARRNGWQEEIPPPRAAAQRKKIRYLCAILEKNGAVLIVRRPLSGLLPGLWEFPGGEKKPGELPSDGIHRLIAERLGIRAEAAVPCAALTQILSHRELKIQAFRVRWNGGRLKPSWYIQTKWAPKKELLRVPFTAGMSKLARSL